MSEFSWVEGVQRVTVFTGAGISTDSGVPDYRGPQGIWTKNPELADLFTFDNFVSDPEVRARYWQVFAERRRDVEPNAAHRALAELERAGTALRIITQNVDGLHQKAGSTPRKVVELHGTLATAVCLECRTEVPSAEAVARLPEEPVCACGGLLKPSRRRPSCSWRSGRRCGWSPPRGCARWPCGAARGSSSSTATRRPTTTSPPSSSGSPSAPCCRASATLWRK